MAACLGILGWLAPAVSAQPIDAFSVQPTNTQAGGTTNLDIDLDLDPSSTETAERVEFQGPPGLIAIPTAVASCTTAELVVSECGPGSQVGTATIDAEGEDESAELLGTAAVYSLVPESGEFSRLGLRIPGLGTAVTGALSLLDANQYGMRVALDGLPAGDALASLSLSLWGVPADSTHDAERLPKGTTGCPGLATAGCATPSVSGLALRRYIQNPTVCGGTRLWVAEIYTHQNPSIPTMRPTSYPATTGCDQLGFHPAFDVEAAASIGAQTPLELRLNTPQVFGPAAPSASQLKTAEIDFDGGIELRSEVLAERLECSPDQFLPGNDDPVVCPSTSLLGTAEVDGAIYDSPVAAQVFLTGIGNGGFDLFLAGNGQGVSLKLPIRLESDSETEGLRASFPALPQLPLEAIELHFFGGENSPFLTFGRCEAYPVKATLTPWDAALSVQTASLSFVLDEGLGGGPCPGPATNVAVSVAPQSVAADGTSVVEATASVTDAAGRPVLEDDVRFSSSDPGQRISPAYEFEDGTYGADVTASTTGGRSTVTATDFSVLPAISGSANLLQVSSTQLPSAAAPVTTFTKRPPKRSRKRATTFAFNSTVAGSSFFCKLDSAPYRRCTSPKRLTGLKPRKHTFRVYAISPTNVKGQPAAFEFRVRKPKARGRPS